jgi:hypothetical protein
MVNLSKGDGFTPRPELNVKEITHGGNDGEYYFAHHDAERTMDACFVMNAFLVFRGLFSV